MTETENSRALTPVSDEAGPRRVDILAFALGQMFEAETSCEWLTLATASKYHCRLVEVSLDLLFLGPRFLGGIRP